MDTLQVVGIGLEGVGLLIALFGLHSRYKEFAPPGRSEFDPALNLVRRSLHRFVVGARARIDRLLRRHPHVEAHAGAAHATGQAHAAGRGRVGYGPLPVARSNKPALAELQRRTIDLLDRISNVDDKLQDETVRLGGEIGSTRDELLNEVQRLEQQIRRLATGDVLIQYVGLAMIAVGLILQGIGAAMGNPAPAPSGS